MTGRKRISANYMDSIPKHSKDRPWHVRKDGMVEIVMKNKGFYHFIAQKFFKKPRTSYIALEKYGTIVWQSIDGKNTVYDIVRIMEEKFPDEKERMLDRVVTYMATLQKNRFIEMS